jgi:hypothetical protein
MKAKPIIKRREEKTVYWYSRPFNLIWRFKNNVIMVLSTDYFNGIWRQSIFSDIKELNADRCRITLEKLKIIFPNIKL